MAMDRKKQCKIGNPMICKIKVAVITMQLSVTRIRIKDMNSSFRSSKTARDWNLLQERPFVSESRVEFQTALEQVEKALEAAAANGAVG